VVRQIHVETLIPIADPGLRLNMPHHREYPCAAHSSGKSPMRDTSTSAYLPHLISLDAHVLDVLGLHQHSHLEPCAGMPAAPLRPVVINS
jgi:hypothetical protein